MKPEFRNYDMCSEFPDFDSYDDGRFRCLVMNLDDGRYVVVTDMGGMGYPAADDFMVCVYVSEEAFGDDPSGSLLASATSDNFVDIDHALHAVEFCGVQL